MKRPGVPGTFSALLIGDMGVKGTSTLVCFSRSLCDMYPNPISDGWGCGTRWVVVMAGPEKGFRPARVGPIGEFTEVASANRAVLGVLSDNVEEPDDVRDLIETLGLFFSSDEVDVCARSISGFTSVNEFDILTVVDLESRKTSGSIIDKTTTTKTYRRKKLKRGQISRYMFGRQCGTGTAPGISGR